MFFGNMICRITENRRTFSRYFLLLYTNLMYGYPYQRTNGPENAHLKPDPGVLSHHEMTLTLNTHTPLLNS